jgi:hypothetical protein
MPSLLRVYSRHHLGEQNMSKALAIRLEDASGKVYRWVIDRELPAAGFKGGWRFTDHEGYGRITEGNWNDLVARFHRVAANYGLILLSELS